MMMEGEMNIEEDRDWTHLPEELLELILSNLFLDDVKRFHHVCRSWKSVLDPNPDFIERTPVQFPVVNSQWLMHKDLSKITCEFFHPIYRETYCLDIPELSDPENVDSVDVSWLSFSKDGWLLMSEGRFSFFFYNPFTSAMFYLPDLPDPEVNEFRGVTFLSEPTSPDFMIFGISVFLNKYTTISIIRHGEENWSIYRFDNNLPIIASYCTPIYHNGLFYCLGVDGNLGVFDPKDNQWTVLDNPKRPCKRSRDNYLLDYDGELMAVFVGKVGLFIRIFKLDESKMAWEEVTNLGDNMLFISQNNSFSRKKVINGMENKVYLPYFHKGFGVFYSLDTGRYHTLLNDFSSTNLYGTEEQLNCCWIEPRLDHHTEEQLDWFGEDSKT